MTRHRAARRGARLRPVLVGVFGAVLLALSLAPAGAASASLGSVPAEVSAYVSSGAMVARLNDVYGPNAAGNAGISFDSSTKAGPISRVYEWTAQRLANQKTDHPVQLTNNWVVPITLGGRSIGLATIWINPQTVDPELASFTTDAAAGTALATVPATAALVRDTPTGAWLALADGKVTALVAGTSGLTTPAPVGSLRLSPTAATPITSAAEPNTGLVLAIGVVGLIVVVIVVALLLPRSRRRARAKAADVASLPSSTMQPAEPELLAAAPAAPAAPAASAEPEPAASAAPASRPPRAKPAGARPAGRTPTTATAAKPASSKPGATQPAARKPVASKPPVSKPPVSKPPVSKPPVSKPPVTKPRAPRPKPPAAEPGDAGS